ncbi:PKHA6 protein, partial [Cinclus mexicanus]|nr:PKHA6 protein [Cinclus mexicanus]
MSSKANSKRPATVPSEPPNHAMVAEVPPERPGGRAPRSSRKGIAFGKRSNSMKRNPNAAVTKSGWLYKQASSGVKQWNKRWFVLVDRCLFYYKDEKEENILGSIPLLSFRVAAVQPSDNISRKHTFKVTVCWVEELPAGNGQSLSPQAEHAGIRTYFFSAENTEEQESWIQAMGEAARVQIPPTQRHSEKPDSENIPPSKHHHHHCNAAHREHAKAEPDTKARGEGDGRGSEKMERKPPERADGKKDPLAKTNGLAGQEPPSEPGTVPGLPWNGQLGAGGLWEELAAADDLSGFVTRHRGSSATTGCAQLVGDSSVPVEWHRPARTVPGSRDVPLPVPPGKGDAAVPNPSFQSLPQQPTFVCRVTPARLGTEPWGSARACPCVRLRAGPRCRRPCPSSCLSVPSAPSWLCFIHDRPPPKKGATAARGHSWSPWATSGGGTLRPEGSWTGHRCHGRVSPLTSSIASGARLLSPSPGSQGWERGVGSCLPFPARPRGDATLTPRSALQVTPFPEPYRDTLHSYKISEQDTDKLLGKLCEQNKVLREQERLVQQLRAEKESLESALMGTHQELEMFGSQPAYPEKLLHKKESLQNQLINIRVELSQASTALANSTAEYESLESEVSTLHDDLWEQLNLDIQNEMLNRQIQKEIWRIQDVMEGLRKNNPSRGTDTAKHRASLGPSGTYSSNSPASPLSSASLTSPLSPFSLISGSQGSPTKPGPGEPKSGFEQSKKEPPRPSPPGPTAEGLPQSRPEQDGDKQAALNKVGIVPPRTKSPAEDEVVPRRNGLANGLSSRERPKSAVFATETKVKMSVEEQIDRMKRHQSGSMKEKRRSLQLPSPQQLPGPQPDPPGTKTPSSYKVVRRHRSIHEVDISDLEAALRSDEPGKVYETPQEEIARLRKMELEPQHYDVDINKELSTPDKVLIPERYVELEPESPLSPEEMKEKQKKVERIKTLIAKSSLQNVIPLGEGEVDTPQDPEMQLQEQEKRIEISCALAAEASRRSRMLSAQCATPSPPTSPASPTPPTNPLSSESPRAADSSHLMRV